MTAAQTTKTPARTQRNFLLDFDTMLKCLQFDYVGAERFEASGYSEFIGKLYTMNGTMFQSPIACDQMLTQMALHYLAWFQDPAVQLVVGPGAAWHLGERIETQRVGDCLYVVSAPADAPVETGERIVGVNKMTLDEIRPEVERTLRTTVEPADPEREDWSIVLAFAKHLTVRDADGAERVVRAVPGHSAVTARMRAYEAARAAGADAREAAHAAAQADAQRAGADEKATRASGGAAGEGAAEGFALAVEDGVAVLGFEGASAGTVGFAAAAEALGARLDAGGVRGLVIDVRGCAGGGQDEACALVPFALAPGMVDAPVERVWGPKGIVMNFSRRNVDDKVAELGGLRSRLTEPDCALLDATVADLVARRGSGLARDDSDYYAQAAFSAAEGVPARVVVLCDRHTAGAAEWLVRAAKAAGHACVMGRATAGSIDGTCLRTVRLDEDFSLVFPTARYASCCGEGATLGRGIAPDVHLAWKPEQLERDVELERARDWAQG